MALVVKLLERPLKRKGSCSMNKKQLKAKLLFAKDLKDVKKVISTLIDEVMPEEVYDPYEGMSFGDLDDDWGDRG